MAIEVYDPNSTDQRTRIVPDAEGVILLSRGWLQVPGGGGGGGASNTDVAGFVTADGPTKDALAGGYTAILPVVATVTTSATAALNTSIPVDASAAAVTITLPNPTRVGQRVRIEKIDASANVVSVALTLKGSAATISMPFTAEIRTFVAESLTSWRTDSGNTPKSALDATYAQTNDARLSDQRVPTDGSVTDAKVASGGLSQSRITGLATTLAGKADLVGGQIPTSQVPALALHTGVAAANRAAMLALTPAQVQPGDVASVASDPGKGTYQLQADDPSQLANWLLLNAPTDLVQSVNGQNGVVNLAKGDVGLGNVDNTSDAAKPISTATAAALSAAQFAVNVKQYGAKGNGSVDESAAISAALAAMPTVASMPDPYDGVTARPQRGALYFPDGLYSISASIVLPQNVDLIIASGAVIRATAAMAAVIDTAVNVMHQDSRIDCAGTIDCANLADHGIYIRTFAHYEVITPRVYSPKVSGVTLGDPTSSTVSYEGFVVSPYVWRPNAAAVPAGSVGLWTRYATDCHVGGLGSVVVGCDIGVRNDQGNNIYESIHVWGYPPNSQNGNSFALLPSTGFLDASTGAKYINCYADTPSAYGWRFTADDPRAVLVNPRVFLNFQGAADNVVVGVQIDSATTGSITTVGASYDASASRRMAADVAGQTGATFRTGTRYRNVVTPIGDSARPALGFLPTVTAATTLSSASNGCKIANPNASALVVTLASAASVSAGSQITIKNLRTGPSTRNYVASVLGQTVDGLGNVELGRGDSVTLSSDGVSNWDIVSRTQGVGVPVAALNASPVSGTAYQNTAGRPIFCSATYTPTASGSLTLEISIDNSTWQTFDVATFSAAGAAAYMRFTLPAGYYVRLTASGATLGALRTVG